MSILLFTYYIGIILMYNMGKLLKSKIESVLSISMCIPYRMKKEALFLQIAFLRH